MLSGCKRKKGQVDIERITILRFEKEDVFSSDMRQGTVQSRRTTEWTVFKYLRGFSVNQAADVFLRHLSLETTSVGAIESINKKKALREEKSKFT